MSKEQEPQKGEPRDWGPYVLLIVLGIALVAFAIDSFFLATHRP